MFINRISFLVLLSVVVTSFCAAQNNTNSPYTRYGYGELSDGNSGEQHAMGGVAFGARQKTSINTVNPASYNAVDSMTFMFDVGVTGLVSRFSTTDGKTDKKTANLNYITMQFPLSHKMGFSMGLMPYSSVGYNYSMQYTKSTGYDLPDFSSVGYRTTFIGTGGISQVYAGLSVEPFKHLSFGVNAYYMFGSVYNQRSLGLTTASDSTFEVNSLDVNNFRFRLGAQYYKTFNQKHDVTLGVIYEPKMNLNGNFTQISTGALKDSTKTTAGDNMFELPQTFGVGAYYTYNKQWTVGLDYSLTQWGDALFRGKYDLNNRSKISLGGEYVPDMRKRSILKRMSYRAGVSMSDSYYKVNAVTPAKNYTFSVGFGFPMYNNVTNTITMINTSFEYGKIGSTDLLRQDYFRIVLNVAFNEHWFFKSRL